MGQDSVRFKQQIYYLLLIVMLVGAINCTDRIESTLPPVMTPTPHLPTEIPAHLRLLFTQKCASCHGARGEGGKGGNIFRARSRSPRNWATLLKNPKGVEPPSNHPPVEGLTDVEFAAFGEWLSRITKENRVPIK